MWGGKDGVISNKLGNMAHSFLRYTNQLLIMLAHKLLPTINTNTYFMPTKSYGNKKTPQGGV